MYVCMHVCMYVFMYTCICIYVCMYAYICVCIAEHFFWKSGCITALNFYIHFSLIHFFILVCIYIGMYVCMHICMYSCICLIFGLIHYSAFSAAKAM